MDIELSEIAFIVYTLLIICVLENYKEEYIPQEHFTEETSEESQEPTQEPPQQPPQQPPQEVVKKPEAGPPEYGFLKRNKYGNTVSADDLKRSYQQTTTLVLANPWVREEACLPIEGNIGSKINIASEIFGPFVRTFNAL
tara:strand:+ start:4864 stop:5283 length:420 start_codon:yes stop_codon:yes gene_type:complete